MKKNKQALWIRVMCWFLAVLMIFGVATTLIYAILGLL